MNEGYLIKINSGYINKESKVKRHSIVGSSLSGAKFRRVRDVQLPQPDIPLLHSGMRYFATLSRKL